MVVVTALFDFGGDDVRPLPAVHGMKGRKPLSKLPVHRQK